jgi:hypothetical protein
VDSKGGWRRIVATRTDETASISHGDSIGNSSSIQSKHP